MASQRWRRLLFLVPVMLGMAAAFWLVRSREGPQQVPAAEVRMRRLIRPVGEPKTLAELDPAELLGLGARVRLDAGDSEVMGEARFARISAIIDPQTPPSG